MEEVYEFLKETAPTYYLATVEDGNPRVRPFGTIDLYEGRLYIQTGKNKKVYRQILDHLLREPESGKRRKGNLFKFKMRLFHTISSL